MNVMPFHPLADLFPLIEGEPFDDLVEDIRINGIRDPIEIIQSSILDGRNRYRALIRLRDRGAPRGPGWGAFAGEPVADEDVLDPALPWFRRYSINEHGDPLAFVVSKNMKRRHLSDTQRASIAGKIANLPPGRPQTPRTTDKVENPPIGGVSVAAAAEMMNAAPRQVERAKVVHHDGIPELRQAIDNDQIALSTAEKIARLPQPEQVAEVQRHLPNGARAIMGSRHEPDDSLDYFPTPPWATRALVETVFPELLIPQAAMRSAWEPACGEGHIAEVLRDYFGDVKATDIHEYGYGDGLCDFLAHAAPNCVDWIITNPPFKEKSEAFLLRAIEQAEVGVALFLRLQWLETVGRYERIFRDNPPTLIAFFAERVPLCKGRWDPEGDTATAYMWLLWLRRGQPRAPFWIPPGQREALTRPDDVERFTTHPVTKAKRDSSGSVIPHDSETGECAQSAQVQRPVSVPAPENTMPGIPEFLRRPV